MKKIFALGSIFVFLCLSTGCAGALHSATAKGDTKTVEKMLDSGANVNEIGTENGLNGLNGPPLLIASYYCQVETATVLLERGAEVNAPGGRGFRALHMAVEKGCNKVARLLIDKGADLEAVAQWGGKCTPLAFAALNSQSASVKLLIESGADADNAVAYLMSNKHTSAAHLIEVAVEKAHTEKTQPAANQTARAPAVQSEIDQPPAGIVESRNNAYAVVIGIENYRSIPKSDYSRNDAKLVKAYLKALGFQERNIDLITDEKATKTDIEKSIEAWLPNRAKSDSTVIVYFSGHGAPEPSTGDAYLVPYDGDPNYLAVTGYPLKRLYDRLEKLDAKEVIVVLDSCFSGSGGRSVLAKGARPLVMMAAMRTPASNMVILSATQGSQISTSSPDKGHGVFTYYFLKAIKDGKKNIADIYKTVIPQVEDEAKKLNVEQSPSISPDMEKIKGKFVLRK